MNPTPSPRTHPLAELGKDLLAFVWPAECIGCAAPDRTLCSACEQTLMQLHHPKQYASGGPTPWFTLGPHEGLLRELIISFKHGGVTAHTRTLATLLDRSLQPLIEGHLPERSPRERWHPEAFVERALVVPMPSRRRQVRKRGYRHLELLLRRSQFSHSREGFRTLTPLRGRTGQVGLDAAERMRNAAKLALDPRARVAGRDLILVDDIITTGATLQAATDLLTAHGARIVGAAALTHARMRGK